MWLAAQRGRGSHSPGAASKGPASVTCGGSPSVGAPDTSACLQVVLVDDFPAVFQAVVQREAIFAIGSRHGQRGWGYHVSWSCIASVLERQTQHLPQSCSFSFHIFTTSLAQRVEAILRACVWPGGLSCKIRGALLLLAWLKEKIRHARHVPCITPSTSLGADDVP